MSSTIMIVDDMKMNIDLLAHQLGEQYIIIPAIGGEAAIRLLGRRKPDLMLLDVSMPEKDGFDVLRYMKEHREFANIPVIFVTGEQDTDAEERGLELGAVDYVKKPYNASIVRTKVRNHLELKSYRDGLECLVNERTKQLAASREAIIMGMSLMSDRHDKVTGTHIERIKENTRILVNKMMETYPDQITVDLAEQIVLYSPLHDVGKVVISDIILKKAGFLTAEEFNIMKTHTREGAELLRKTEYFLNENVDGDDLKVAIEIAECHHEKYDGTGYPLGLKGDEIPISARLVSVADVYDALRSQRPYKKAFSHEDAVARITDGDEKTNYRHFDPMILSVFISAQDELKRTYE